MTVPTPIRVLLCPDKFRGTLTGPEAAAAMRRGVHAVRPDAVCREMPLADGGEGTLDALGGANRWETVTGPLGEQVRAGWRLDGSRAVIEMAQASGLALAGGAAGNDPIGASTRGTGALIAAALAAGAREILVGVGGSATTDGGSGALEVLAPPGRAPLLTGGVRMTVATDVRTGFLDAAVVFGPQKGATAQQVRALTDRLTRLRAQYRDRFGVDVAELPGAGAAGGLAGGLAAIGAQLTSGFSAVAAAVGFDDALTDSDLVITGEGRLDAESLNGKVVGEVLTRAARRGLPVLVVAGSIAPGLTLPGRATATSLTEWVGHDRAMADAAGAIDEAVRSYAVRHYGSQDT